MRCSGWSSLAISVCSALLLAASAKAHVVPTPSSLTNGSTSTLRFAVPNERQQPMTAFSVSMPEGLVVTDARAVGPWQAHRSPQSAHWVGGRLRADASTTFELDVKADTKSGTAELTAVQFYPYRQTVTWPVAVTVLPGAKPSQHLGRALVAGILGLLAVAGLVVFVRERRTRSLSDS